MSEEDALRRRNKYLGLPRPGEEEMLVSNVFRYTVDTLVALAEDRNLSEEDLRDIGEMAANRVSQIRSEPGYTPRVPPSIADIMQLYQRTPIRIENVLKIMKDEDE